MGRAFFWLLVLGGAAAIFGYFYFTSAVGRAGPNAEARPFVVESGSSGAQIAEALKEQGFIADALH